MAVLVTRVVMVSTFIVLLVVVIGILSALIFTTRAGVQQQQRNSQREADIQALRDGLEGYFAANNRYPSLADLNSDGWRATHLKQLDAEIFRDPLSGSDQFVAQPAADMYAYAVTSASGTECGNPPDQAPCTQYTLTATLEDGGTYTKSSLN